MSKYNISIIDTSVLMYILDIDTGKQPYDIIKKQSIKEEFNYLLAHLDQEKLIMPITTIIETGNHIAHIPNGNKTRNIAMKFNKMLINIANKTAPWFLYGYSLDDKDLQCISTSFVDWTVAGIGIGDQGTIHFYKKFLHDNKNQIHNIRIWSTDQHLQQYHEENI